jgi:hypothetical protein
VSLPESVCEAVGIRKDSLSCPAKTLIEAAFIQMSAYHIALVLLVKYSHSGGPTLLFLRVFNIDARYKLQ